MIPGDQILVVMLGNKSIYPLSHLTLAHPTPFSEIGYSPDWPRSSLPPASASQSDRYAIISSISTLTSSMVLAQNSSPASVCEMHK